MVDVLRSTDLTQLDVELVRWFSDPAADIMIGGCFEQYNLFAEQWGCQTSASEPHWTDLTLGGLDGLDVCLTGLNSVLFSDTSDDPRDGPVLHLGRRQCELQRASNRVHIAFGHHPPGWLRDWEQVEPYLRRAHLLLFGHEHKFGACQRIPGGTVEVFAGAVGPDRTGAPDESYAPSWNMISIERNGDDLAVTIDQRVWFKARTCFDTYPDGDARFTVRVDLADANEATDMRPDDGGEHPGTNPTPLIPDQTEVLEGVSLPSPQERTKLREVAVQFMRLAPTRRMQIADDLGVSAGLHDRSHEQGEVAREILRRVRAANRTEEFISLLSNG